MISRTRVSWTTKSDSLPEASHPLALHTPDPIRRGYELKALKKNRGYQKEPKKEERERETERRERPALTGKMSKTISEGLGFTKGEGCPLCPAKLSAMWKSFEVGRMPCCGQRICEGCVRGTTTCALKQVTCPMLSQDRAGQKKTLQLLKQCPVCQAQIYRHERRLLHKNSENGKGWADYALHVDYDKEDSILSSKYLLLSAKRGFPPALHKIGCLYSTGEHPQFKFSLIDSLQARARAADAGHAQARYEMAFHLIEKKHGGLCEPGTANVEMAIQTMNRAAEEGYAYAYYSLGNIYKHGKLGIEKNERLLQRHFEKGSIAEINSIKNGDGSGTGLDYVMYEMGCFHLEQEEKANKFGVDKAAFEGINAYESYRLAHQMFETAGARGHMPSQEKMAWMLIRTGPTETCYYIAGISWTHIALNNGSNWAKEFLHGKKNKQEWCKICFNCYATAKGGDTHFQKCGKCQIAHYCSNKCQQLHWHEHGHKDYCGNNIDEYKSTPYFDLDAYVTAFKGIDATVSRANFG